MAYPQPATSHYTAQIRLHRDGAAHSELRPAMPMVSEDSLFTDAVLGQSDLGSSSMQVPLLR